MFACIVNGVSLKIGLRERTLLWTFFTKTIQLRANVAVDFFTKIIHLRSELDQFVVEQSLRGYVVMTCEGVCLAIISHS
jgi:hypothetical protein